MAKNKNMIISVVLILLVAVCCITFFTLGDNDPPDVTDAVAQHNETIDGIFSKKYSRGENLTKPDTATNGAWLEATDENADETLGSFCRSVFDTAYISNAFFEAQAKAETKNYGAKYTPDGTQLYRAQNVTEKLHKAGKKVVFEIRADYYDALINELCTLKPDGFTVTGFDILAGEEAAQRMNEIYALIKANNKNCTVIAHVSVTGDSHNFISTENADALFVDIPFDVERIQAALGDYSAYSTDDCMEANTFDAWVSYWHANSQLMKLPFYVGFDTSLNNTATCGADGTLLQTAVADIYGNVSGRVYRSYSDFLENKENSTQAVLDYIVNGLNLETATRRLYVQDYDGGTVKNETGTAQIKLRCSSVFPLYVNGVSYGIHESGETTLSLDLNIGENVFEITQNNKTVTYRADFAVTPVSPLITFVIPNSTVYANGGEIIDITVGAHMLADVTLTIAGTDIDMQMNKAQYGQYTTFTASIIVPEATDYPLDLGNMTFTAKADGVKAETYSGAKIIINAKEPEITTQVQIPAQSTTQINNSSYIPTTEMQTTRPYVSSQGGSSTSKTTLSVPPLDKSVISKVCAVTADFAETRPVTPLSNTSYPTYTPLAKGTMDVICDVVDHNDGEDYVQYYVLQSGRRVRIRDVSVLENCTLSDNSISAVSCTSNDVSTKINLSTVWRVPYNVELTPQSYSKGYEGKLFNVSSFTANTIEIDFYHTVAASGHLDVSASSSISSYGWSTDTARKVSTLYLTLKQPVGFGGYNISYNNDGTLCIEVFNSMPKTLTGTVVMIDAGHGGKDPGALSGNGNAYESDINLSIAYCLKAQLEQRGASVIMTRSADDYVSLEQRRALAELLKPDIFVSIHCNASNTSANHGTSVFYYTPWSQPLASSVFNKLDLLFDNKLYNGVQTSNLSQYFYPFYICRTSVCPSILIETAYITNAVDCPILKDGINQQQIAAAIAEGINGYLAR